VIQTATRTKILRAAADLLHGMQFDLCEQHVLHLQLHLGPTRSTQLLAPAKTPPDQALLLPGLTMPVITCGGAASAGFSKMMHHKASPPIRSCSQDEVQRHQHPGAGAGAASHV
jgi:hypothetical protein